MKPVDGRTWVGAVLACVAALGATGCGAGSVATNPAGAVPGSTVGASASVPVTTPTSAATASGATAAPATGEVSATASPAATGVDVSGIPMELRIKVVADAADRTGAPPGSFTFIKADAVTWPNGALGCPVPGHAYTDMVEPGWWVVLDVAGDGRLDYRLTQRGTVTFCANPPAP